MNNKVIISCLVMIIAIVFVGLYVFNPFVSNDNIKVGESSSIVLPDGFEFDKFKGSKTYIKNDVTLMSIKEVEDSESLDEIVNSYKETYSEKNTVETGSKDLNGVPVVYGSQMDGDKLVAYDYWYEKNDKIFHITVVKENNETAVDSVISSTI